MANSLDVQQTKNMLIYVGEEVINSKPLLTEIDSAIGDGDHGIGMSVGFTKANEKLRTLKYNSVNDIFKTIGMTMVNTMGGASGVIFGTMFIGGVKTLSTIEQLDLTTFSTILENSLNAVKERGKANLGDKTMIDALEPAVEALKKNSDASLLDALKAAEEAAVQGVENSKNYEAKFGRAKSLGERAIGHQDPGATTISIIFRSMREYVESGAPA